MGWISLSLLPAGCVRFSDDFFESSTRFWATPTRARIWESLGSFLDDLLEVRRLLYFFSAMDITCYNVNSMHSYHSLLLVSI